VAFDFIIENLLKSSPTSSYFDGKDDRLIQFENKNSTTTIANIKS
jgi:hypothetical protein